MVVHKASTDNSLLLLPDLRIFALGIPHDQGAQQLCYFTPLPEELFWAWQQAYGGIALSQWADLLQQHKLIGNPGEAFHLFYAFRQAHLLVELPLVYLGQPGPAAPSMGIRVTAAAAIPVEIHPDIWNASNSVQDLCDHLMTDSGWSASRIGMTLQTILRHPEAHLVSLLELQPARQPE